LSAVAAGSEQRTTLDRLRWPLCLLVVLGIHGVAVLRLREIKPTPVAVNAPPAVSLDLAPLPAPPTVAPTPPAPAATEPPPPTEPPPVATEPPPPEPAPLPPEPEAVLPDPLPLPPPAVPPEVALPRPVPLKRPPPVRHTAEKPPQTVTPPTTTPPTEAPAARPAQAAPPQAAAAPGAAAESWKSALAAYLAKFKRYPVSAQRRGEQGVAQVRFSVDRNGMAHAVTLFRSSGHADLDAEAQSLVERAQPLPVPPADISGVASDVVIPVHFSLH
jgi:periplasmic protein TonB